VHVTGLADLLGGAAAACERATEIDPDLRLRHGLAGKGNELCDGATDAGTGPGDERAGDERAKEAGVGASRQIPTVPQPAGYAAWKFLLKRVTGLDEAENPKKLASAPADDVTLITRASQPVETPTPPPLPPT
jgi:hypothetical protein